ncbi:MAG TPA: ATP-binding protein [Candidatus Eisenbacteria bacterium]|nr:ATP-binding protein [Candidatus Eisenbacteria bacterium]
MRIWIRWKIVLFTVPLFLAVALIALWMVQRTVSAEVRRNMDADLKRASALFETKLAERANYLSMASRVIAEDPRFFSALTLPGTYRDPQFRATVAGIARSFAGITRTDLFEVYDAQGRLITSVGPEESDKRSRSAIVLPALSGRPETAVLAAADRHHQVAVTPVFAGGRVVGSLLLGDRIGRQGAEALRDLTRSEVTFLTDRVITGTTLVHDEDRAALLRALDVLRGRLLSGGAVVEIKTRDQVRLTLIAQLPDAAPWSPNYYALQRSIDAETGFLREIQARLVELGIFGAIVAVLLGLVISQRITAPIRKLVRGAEEMERGNYEYPLDVTGRDEMAYLAARFDAMRRHQRAYVSSLQEIARVKGEFLSIASHELRTPVSVIRGYNDLLSRDLMGPTTAAQKEALEAIGRAAHTLHRIAEDATRLAEIEGDRLSLNLIEQDVATLLRSAIETARSEAKGRSVEVTLDVSRRAGTAVIDGPKMIEAVTNLVRNGIRFTPDGGTVKVSAHRDGGTLVIEVADSGIGISEDQARAIFDPAVMVRDSKRHHSSDTLEFNSAGLGLGLSIARGIVEFHGGTVEVESALGRGSKFRIRIPADEARHDVPRSDVARADQNAGGDLPAGVLEHKGDRRTGERRVKKTLPRGASKERRIRKQPNSQKQPKRRAGPSR